MKEKIKYAGASGNTPFGTKKKLLGLLLAVFMVLTLAPTTARADVATEKWTDFAAPDFAGGAGTKDNPYQIATAGQLAKLANEVNSGIPEQTHSGEYFKLTAPIDLSGKRWVPIGYGNLSSKSFSGYFDGNNQVITGLYVDERGKNVCAGLFGVVVAISDETVLKNFCIENATIYAGNSTDSSANAHPNIYGAGVLAGSLTTMGGSSATFIGVENCQGTGQVDSGMYAGGLIGDASRAHVSDCSADVTVTGTCVSGGFIGNDYKGSYKNCTAKGNVSGGWSTGGFAGCVFEVDASAEIEHCASYGDVTANNWNTGGFVGYLEKGEISNSVSYGNVTNTVTGWEPKTGGFSGGNIGGKIQNCSAAGTVTGSHPTIAPGGFIGYDDGGTTAGCAFDQEKNPALNGVGEDGKTPGSNQIAAVDTKSLDSNICGSYRGGHTLSKVDAKEATQTIDGNIEYWICTKCGSYFSDAGGTTAIKAADVVIPKKAAETPEGEIKTPYAITEGTGSSYALQSGSSLTVRGNGDFSKFTGIKVDGVQIGAENYEAKSGSTIVTLKSSYLDTLTAGTHSLEILWTDGSASTAFAIQQSESQKPDDDVKELNTNQNPANQNPQSVPQNNTEQTDSMKNESPKTGEDDNLLVLAAWLFLLGSGFAGVTYYRKRKHLY
jgi:LPXTG-motif cell wall-anchored protein